MASSEETLITPFDALQYAAKHFWDDPLTAILRSFGLLICGFLLLPAGPALFFFMRNLEPPSPQLMQEKILYFQTPVLLKSSFFLGLFIALSCWIPLLSLCLAPFLFMAFVLSYRYILSISIATKATIEFIKLAPRKAFVLLGFFLLAVSGLLLCVFGVVITLPIGLRAAIRYCNACAPEFSIAIQKAYK